MGSRLAGVGQLLGSIAGGVGWWLPWALHPGGAAALVLLGLDLGEFFKFTPVWHPPISEVQWERGAFFVPPVATTLLLATWLPRRAPMARPLLALPLLFLALVVLPAYPYTTTQLTSPEFRLQTVLALMGTGGIVALAALRQQRGPTPRSILLLRALLGLGGAALPLWAFWRVLPLLNSLYGRPVEIGVGLVLSSGGFLLVTLLAAVRLWRGHDPGGARHGNSG